MTNAYKAEADAPLKAPFFTYDGDVQETVFALRAMRRVLPDLPVQWLIPFTEPAIRQQIAAGLRGLDIRFVRTEPDTRSTLRRLLSEVRGERWVFWSTCDRYPIAADPAFDATTLGSDLKRGAFDAYCAIKLVRWIDARAAPNTAARHHIAGVQFQDAPYSQFGFWHPQFIRVDLLRAGLKLLIDGGGHVGQRNRDWAERLEAEPRPTLVPVEPVLKVEEPFRKGQVTLNYEARRRRAGLPATQRGRLHGVTKGFTDPALPAVNRAMDTKGLERWLVPVPSDHRFYLTSFGGVGSKMLIRALYNALGEGATDRVGASHTHRRLPPPALHPGQCAVYVFGDPRDAVLSFFQRRDQRHARHGFGEARNLVSKTPHWALQHLKHIAADPGPLDETWDLARYLQHGADLFRLEEHFDNWVYAWADYPITFVRYDTLWSRIGILAAHFGLPTLSLPQREQRAAQWRGLPAPDRAQLNGIYGRFAARLDTLPDAFVMLGGHGFDLTGGQPVTFQKI